MGIGAGNDGLTGLNRLTQRIQHTALEFRKFVEEQHTLMC